MVDWVVAALGASVLFGLINNLDSHLISRRMPGLRAFLLITCLVILVILQPFIFLFPVPVGVQSATMAAAIVSALVRAGAVIIMLFSFKSEEVVGVVPLVYTYPVFVALTAVPLLGESLNAWQWLAVLIVATAAILVALRPKNNGVGRWLGKNFPILVLAALLFAGADISGKYALQELDSFTLYWMSMLTLVILSLGFSLRPSVIRSLKTITRPRVTACLLFLNETLVVCAAVLSFWAMKNGPISLVSTILASRPVFVFITAIVLSRVFPGFVYWQSGGRALGYKFGATLAIIIGVAIIYLVDS
ncbi:MAG: DMT family transporter [Dehalococcoidaceae bacterium]|nr:DMT family transporter [Dehalococcoidaceae bacterium]